MKKLLLFMLFFFSISSILLAQGVPGGDAPTVSPGKHFVHIATASNSTANYTKIDNSNTNSMPDAKIFISHNYNASGSGIYNNHVSGLWYNGSQWTIFNQDAGSVPIIVNSAYHILVADDTQSTVFQHTARPANINSNWTALTHPELDGNPNARILVTQILIDTAGNTYNNREVGVFYNGTNWAIFNENMDAMIDGASFNVLILDYDNSILHTATSSNIVSATTQIDHPALNNNPDAIIYVTQNWNPGGGAGVFNEHKVSTYYYSGKWSIYNEDAAGMIENSHYNIYIGASSFVHKTTADNNAADLTQFDNPLVNRDADAVIFAIHTWNPFGSPTTTHNKTLGLYFGSSGWGIFNQDMSAMPQNIYFNIVTAPKTDSAFLHTTTASNISGGNYTTIDNPLTNNNPDAKLLVQHVYKTSRQNTNLGVWYSSSSSKWTIFTEDNSVMTAGKDFNVWLLDDNKSFVHQIDTTGVTNAFYSYIDNPFTNNNPDAKILVTAVLGNYFDHVIGVWYSTAEQKWVLYTEDGEAFTHNTKFNVYVTNSLGSPTLIEEENNPLAVSNFELQQNYPNPFNPTTLIRFTLAEQSQINLKVYNILGKEIATLVNDIKGAGIHEVSFDGSGLASGVYFYTLQTEQFNQTRKMILIK